AKYHTSEGLDKGVFKPLRAPDKTRTKEVEGGWVAKRIGIDPFNPPIAMRKIATCAVPKMLGSSVVPRTELGSPPPTPPPPIQPTQLGTVMSMAQGGSASQAHS